MWSRHPRRKPDQSRPPHKLNQIKQTKFAKETNIAQHTAAMHAPPPKLRPGLRLESRDEACTAVNPLQENAPP